MKNFFLLLLVTFGQLAFSQPVITDFSPLAAPPGAMVTINGANFSPIPANNTVYFGAVRGTVTAASATSIQATVPYGATYDLITVATNNLTAYSAKKFLLTTGNSGTISSTTYASKQDFITGSFIPAAAVADFDGDGRTDIVAANYTNATLAVFRNTTVSPTNINLAASVNFAASGKPGDVKTGDINGDGKPDIVTANDASRTVSVFLNTCTNGIITFEAKQDFPAGTYCVAVAIGDIDGDGKADVIELNNQESTVSVLRNTSTGTTLSFASRVSFPTGAAPSKVVAVDLDEDGKQEIIVSNQYSNSVSVLKNLSTPGSIIFAAKVDFATNGNARDIDFGDFNNDNKTDIVAGSSDTSITLLTNTSAGSAFSFSRQDKRIGTTPQSVALNDIDGDGKPDLASVGSEVNIALLQNISQPGTTSFAGKVEYAKGGSSYQVIIADLTNDGRNDLIVAGFNTLSFIRNKMFEPVITSFTPATGPTGTTVLIKGQNFTGAFSVRFGSAPALNFSIVNDSTITAVAGYGNTGNITVQNSVGVGFSSTLFTYITFPPVITSVTPGSGSTGTLVAIKGQNFVPNTFTTVVRFGAVKATVVTASDTVLTVIVPPGTTYEPVAVTKEGLTAYSPKPFDVIFAGSNGMFSTNTFSAKTDSATGNNPYAVALGDFDQDGRADIVVTNYNSASIAVYRNTSDSIRIAIVSMKNYTAGSGPRSIAVTDVDGDGRLDIAIANSLSNTVSVFRNTGTNSIPLNFATKIDLPTPNMPVAIKYGDLNADGKPELAVICRSGLIAMFRNTSVSGVVSFGARTDSIIGSYPTGLAITDLDGDGKPDLAITDSASGNIIFYRNTTNNNTISFAAREMISAGANQAIATADMDDDGKPDLIVTKYSDTTITIYKNQSVIGSLSFTNQQYLGGTTGFCIAIADIDGDGKPDVGSSTRSSSKISLLRNAGAGVIGFNSFYQYQGGMNPYGIAFGDMDGDSKPEIVSANYFSNTISIFRNQVDEVIKTVICPGGNTSIISNVQGTSYQWQVDTGTGYINITDNAKYTGTNIATLQLSNIPSSWYGYKYRCIVAGSFSDVYTLKFQNSWIGTSNTNWENPANWACGTVPDANTDVIIASGNVLISSNVTIRSVRINPGAQVAVTTGFTCTILY